MSESKEQIFISVVIPCFNCKKYILNTLNSIVEQTYKNFEIIIIDDGSQDDSYKIIEEYFLNKNKITYSLIRQENAGAAVARNVGIENSKGEYIRFIDSDDFIPKDSLEKMVFYAEKYRDIPIILGPIIYYWSEERNEVPNAYKEICSDSYKIVKPFDASYLSRNAGVWNKLWKKEFLIKNQKKFIEGNIIEDEEFTFSAYMLAEKILIMPIDDIVYFWVHREGSTSRSGHHKRWIHSRIKITRKLEETIELTKSENTPLVVRIRKRLLNNLIKMTKSKDFDISHFREMKEYLIYLKNKRVNFSILDNNLYRQIIDIIIKYDDFCNAIKKIDLLNIDASTRGLNPFKNYQVIETILIDRFEVVGNKIKNKSVEQDCISHWANRDSIFFTINNFEKGIYEISIVYSWNSRKTVENNRSGVLVSDKKHYIPIVFERTKNFDTYKEKKVIFYCDKDYKSIYFSLRAYNHPGVGFINLKNITFNKINLLSN